jgi:hypothetical protein
VMAVQHLTLPPGVTSLCRSLHRRPAAFPRTPATMRGTTTPPLCSDSVSRGRPPCFRGRPLRHIHRSFRCNCSCATTTENPSHGSRRPPPFESRRPPTLSIVVRPRRRTIAPPRHAAQRDGRSGRAGVTTWNHILVDRSHFVTSSLRRPEFVA